MSGIFKRRMDFHTHTSFSDGQYTPTQLIGLAEKADIAVLGVTDHDTIDGLAEAFAAGKSAGITVLGGIEFSARGNDEMHILGYCFDTKNPALNSACDDFKFYRDRRGEKILAYLEEYGVSLSMEDVIPFVESGVLARPHFARAMVARGYVATVREAFDKYLATEDFRRVERKKPSPADAISLITNAGGTAVLAHPISLKLDSDALEKCVGELKECGLGGLECYHSNNDVAFSELSLRLAKKYDLIVTGGSDFHGEKVKPNIALGSGAGGNLSFYDEGILLKLKFNL